MTISNYLSRNKGLYFLRGMKKNNKPYYSVFYNNGTKYFVSEALL